MTQFLKQLTEIQSVKELPDFLIHNQHCLSFVKNNPGVEILYLEIRKSSTDNSSGVIWQDAVKTEKAEPQSGWTCKINIGLNKTLPILPKNIFEDTPMLLIGENQKNHYYGEQNYLLPANQFKMLTYQEHLRNIVNIAQYHTAFSQRTINTNISRFIEILRQFPEPIDSKQPYYKLAVEFIAQRQPQKHAEILEIITKNTNINVKPKLKI